MSKRKRRDGACKGIAGTALGANLHIEITL